MRRTLLLVGVITWSLATPLRGGDATIEFFSSAFLPQSVEIGFGETVTWNWISGSHTLTSGTPTGAPGTADEPGTLFSVPLDAANPTFSYTFTTGAGLDFHFFDSQNPVQVGTIEVLGDDETFIVGVVAQAEPKPCRNRNRAEPEPNPAETCQAPSRRRA